MSDAKSKQPEATAGWLTMDFGESGAVILNPESGNYFRLNTSALELLSEPSCQANELVDMINAEPDPVEPGPWSFEPTPDAPKAHFGETATARISADGSEIEYEPEHDLTQDEIANHLMWLLPHALALQGWYVLHAAAFLGPDGVVAITGPSGAGKSTTARAFEARYKRLSDDLVLIGAETRVWTGAEDAMRAWADESTNQIKSGVCNKISVPEGNVFSQGECKDLRHVWFLDTTRRCGTEFAAEALDAPDFLCHLLENSFAETGNTAVWQMIFKISSRLTDHVKGVRMISPDGIDHLAQAVNAYNFNSTA